MSECIYTGRLHNKQESLVTPEGLLICRNCGKNIWNE